MCIFINSSQGRVLVTQWCRQSDGKGYPDFKSFPLSSPPCFHRIANVMGEPVMLSHCALNAATTLSKSYSRALPSQKTEAIPSKIPCAAGFPHFGVCGDTKMGLFTMFCHTPSTFSFWCCPTDSQVCAPVTGSVWV